MIPIMKISGFFYFNWIFRLTFFERIDIKNIQLFGRNRFVLRLGIVIY